MDILSIIFMKQKLQSDTMLRSALKIIAGSLDNFFWFLYRTYGPFFFLLLSGVFSLFALTPDIVEKNGFPVPPAFWWFCSVSYIIMFFDMRREEKKKIKPTSGGYK